MAKLSREQIAAYAKGAGFTGNDINIAVAVALAESGGRTEATNMIGADNSYGLWQINMIGSMGPARRKEYNLGSNSDLLDPAVNARVAFGIWNKNKSWGPWTTYTRGTYKKFMDGDTSDAPSQTTSQGLSPTLGITASINTLGENLLKAVAGFGGVLVAIALAVVGFVLLARNPIASLVPATKLGKVAKVAKKVSS